MIQQLITTKNAVTFFLWLCVVAMFGIDHFNALLSISMAGFVLVCFLAQKPANWFHNILSNRLLLSITISALCVIPSVLYSSNLSYFGLRLQILVPFIIMPMAYAQVNELSPSHKKIIIYTFIIGIIISAIQALTYYYFHQSEINQAYLESRVMPTAVSHHPTFSLMCALTIYLLYNETQMAKKMSVKVMLTILTIFLIAFLHIFSVRAGILAFYLLVMLSIYQLLIPKKRYLTAAIVLLISTSIAFTTYLFSPTIKNKIANTQADLSNYKSGGNQNNQSLGSRLISYQFALEINKNSSRLLGCGLGDIEDLNNKLFEERYPLITKKIIPHNQFLYYFAAIGALGVLVFFVSFYFPIYKQLSNFNLLAVYSIITVAFLIEAFLTTQLGVSFCIIFILLFIHHPSKKIN